jgi:glutaredoxin
MGDFLNAMFKSRFRTGLFLVLAAAFLFTASRQADHQPTEVFQPSEETLVAHVFHSPACPHCRKELAFLRELNRTYPRLQLILHNIDIREELELLVAFMEKRGVPTDQIATPTLFIGDRHLIGFHEPETTGARIEAWIKDEFNRLDQGIRGSTTGSLQPERDPVSRTISLPLVGEVSPFEMSLPALAITLGVIDGFNPCAMWVLVYLISLIVGLKDRTRIYTLIGTFLLASGVLYFLFMTAWLNAFLYLGYIRPLTILIGLAAIYLGALSIEDFIRSGGRIVCEVGDLEDRQKTRLKIRELVSSPLTWTSFAGIVALAFAVNSIEFICSSAMPALFTHVLSVADLPALSHYLYILLYVLFFMLDDLVIFLAAAFAVERFAGEKYAGFCKLAGGGVMIGLGVLLTFYPDVLR